MPNFRKWAVRSFTCAMSTQKTSVDFRSPVTDHVRYLKELGGMLNHTRFLQPGSDSNFVRLIGIYGFSKICDLEVAN